MNGPMSPAQFSIRPRSTDRPVQHAPPLEHSQRWGSHGYRVLTIAVRTRENESRLDALTVWIV